MSATIHHGDCLDVLRGMPDNSVDAICCDPPYGLSNTRPDLVAETITRWATRDREFVPGGVGFMGQRWDAFVPPPAVWDECLRVLKPGGHLAVFAGSRTVDLMGISLRFAGADLRDSLMWVHGQGFPKGNSQLKPAQEPILLARKPFKGTTKGNVENWGTGALNIDAARIDAQASGRWPANVVLDADSAETLDQQSGTLKSGSRKAGIYRGLGYMGSDATDYPEIQGDEGGASRFFKIAEPDMDAQEFDALVDSIAEESKETRRRAEDKHRETMNVEPDPPFMYAAKAPKKERPRYEDADGNVIQHPTTKPLSIMKWLVRLTCPPGGTILDPFAGSGTTIEAAMLEGFNVIGIEREAEYLPLIQQRIDRATDVLPMAS